MNRFIITILINMFFFASTDARQVEAGRYHSINLEVEQELKDPFKTIVDFNFPPEVKNVGTALELALAKSGYKIVDGCSSFVLYNFSFPRHLRNTGPIVLNDLIDAIIGSHYSMKTNHFLRHVMFVSNRPITMEIVNKEKKKWSGDNSNVVQYKPYKTSNGDSLSKIAFQLNLKFDDEFKRHFVEKNSGALINRNPDLLKADYDILVPIL